MTRRKVVGQEGGGHVGQRESFTQLLEDVVAKNGVAVFAINPEDEGFVVGADHQVVLDQLPQESLGKYVVGTAIRVKDFQSASADIMMGSLTFDLMGFDFYATPTESLKKAAAFLVRQGVNPDKNLILLENSTMRVPEELRGVAKLRDLAR